MRGLNFFPYVLRIGRLHQKLAELEFPKYSVNFVFKDSFPCITNSSLIE